MVTTSSPADAEAMANSQEEAASALAPALTASQQKPRPLVLFLDLLRSETAAEPARMVQALQGLRAYQEAERAPPPEPMPAVAHRKGAALRDYGGSGPPVLFVPSLINPPTILDLGRGKIAAALAGGARPPRAAAGLGTGPVRAAGPFGRRHVTELLLPLMREIGEPPALAGYCLGGTMAIAAAALAPVRQLLTIAAPWRFCGFPDASRRQLGRLWESASPTVAALGVLPMEVLQSAFWSLDPHRTVSKFEMLASLPADSAQARSFVTMEDWANDGRDRQRRGREMFRGFLRRRFAGQGRLGSRGSPDRPRRFALPRPATSFPPPTDRAAASAPAGGERLELALGHVGMVAGSRAREALWEPLDRWLSEPAAD
jgi:polyhydroxyalkanoate synthase